MVEEIESSTVLPVDKIENWRRSVFLELEKYSEKAVFTQVEIPQLALEYVNVANFNIEIPLGNLFYPCCGDDSDDSINDFAPYTNVCHFSDPYKRISSRKKSELDKVKIDHIGEIVLGINECEKHEEESAVINYHKKDGLLTLIEDISDLAIFYYRGDSYAEGGSNQRWLEPVLFHYILSRLYDGGLIVTDGSNCGHWNDDIDEYVVWNCMCSNCIGGRSVSDEKDICTEHVEEFKYLNRIFRYIGKASGRDTHNWQVSVIRK
jgi:hypothetical protein